MHVLRYSWGYSCWRENCCSGHSRCRGTVRGTCFHHCVWAIESFSLCGVPRHEWRRFSSFCWGRQMMSLCFETFENALLSIYHYKSWDLKRYVCAKSCPTKVFSLGIQSHAKDVLSLCRFYGGGFSNQCYNSAEDFMAEGFIAVLRVCVLF